MSSSILSIVRDESKKIRKAAGRNFRRRKPKINKWDKIKTIGTCAAVRLAFYMNHHYDFDGHPVIYDITEIEAEDYLKSIITSSPSFSWTKLPNNDKNHFMACAWVEDTVDTTMLPILRESPRWKRLPDFIRPFFFEAAIRTHFKCSRIVNVDARWAPKLLPVLKEAKNPASLLLDRIRDAANAQLGYAPGISLILEMLSRKKVDGTPGKRNKFSPHPHFTLAVRPETTNAQIEQFLTTALGTNTHTTQFCFTPAYVNRGTYITKQASYTSYHMEKCGFKSKKFFAASNEVRHRAAEICDDELCKAARFDSTRTNPRELLLSALLRNDSDAARAVLNSIE